MTVQVFLIFPTAMLHPYPPPPPRPPEKYSLEKSQRKNYVVDILFFKYF